MFGCVLRITIICIIFLVPKLDAFVGTFGGSVVAHQKQQSTTRSLIFRTTSFSKDLLTIRGGSDGKAVVAGDSSAKTKTTTTTLPAALTSFVPMTILGTWLTNSLQGGPLGVIGLTLISSSICVPITQYKNLYGISVGFGLSVAAIAVVLRNIFVISPWSINDALSGAAIFYGLRLAAFLFIRDISGAKSLDATKKSGRLQRIPFALSLALFYAFIMTPMLYGMRNPLDVTSVLTWQSNVAWTGCGLAWFGAFVEAIADTHKYIVKGRSNSSAVAFRGPTHGLYGITRHPNYTGEVLFWVGIFVGGLPAFGNSIIAWLCSTAGIYGIVSIMRGATKSLETKQKEKYGGQPKYETWTKDVPVALFPFL